MLLRAFADTQKNKNKQKQKVHMSDESPTAQRKREHSEDISDERLRSELKQARDLVRRHRRETAQCRARVIELETLYEATQAQLVEARAAAGYMATLLLRKDK